MAREEELIQKAKEVREALIEMAADEVDATHIEVGQIKAKDDVRKLLTVRVANANRYVPYQGHDTSEFTVGDYWAIIFDDYGTIRLGWWMTDSIGGGTVPLPPITAADVANVPGGGIAATDVQAAIDELDTEKMASLEVQEDDVKVLDATIVNFEGGGGKVVDEGGGKATVDITGGGGAGTIEIQEDDVKVLDASILNFEGGGGKVVDEGGGKGTVDITGGGGPPAADFTIWRPDAPPVVASALDDEFDDAAFDAVLWTEFDPSADITPSETEEGLILTAISDPGDDIGGIYQSIPSGDFTIVTRVSLRAKAKQNYAKGGLALWEDPADNSGDIYHISLTYDGTNQLIGAQRFSNWQTYHSTLGFIADVAVATHAYLRIRRANGTYAFEWGSDGMGWHRLYSGALAFVPIAFGVQVDNVGSGLTIAARFGFFRYKDSDVGLLGIMEGDRIDGWRS